MLSGAARARGLSGCTRRRWSLGCRSYSAADEAKPNLRPLPQAAAPWTSGEKGLIEVRGRSFAPDSWFNIPPNVLETTSRRLHLKLDHPIDITRRLIESYFPRPGFRHFSDFHPVVTVEENFDALGFPPDHPGRARTDTYYISNDKLLRTHTSAHQAEVFAGIDESADGYLITADVYRRDEIDRSHYPVFHQMEGARSWNRTKVPGGDVTAAIRKDTAKLARHDLAVEDSTPAFHPERNPLQDQHHSPAEAEAVAAHLKLSLENMVAGVFSRAESQAREEPLRMRWVEAYFPFTSPSWELEILYDGNWVEVLGCGVVKHQLHVASGRPSRLGWAFGLGLDRIAMLLFRIPDIRLLWSLDKRFHQQFRGLSERPPQKLEAFETFSKHPPCPKDVSFWLRGDSLPDIDVIEVVRSVARDLVEEVKCIDRFTHPKTGRRSKAYRIVYRSLDRTLTHDEANEIHEQVRRELEKQFGAARLRQVFVPFPYQYHHPEARPGTGTMADDRSESPDSGAEQQPRVRKRQRVRLSCLECRRRKLSCDRGFPCERCIKSRTPDRCSYESRSGEVVHASSSSSSSTNSSGLLLLDGRGRHGTGSEDHHERLRRLELEMSQLKSQMARPYDGSTVGGTRSPSTYEDDAAEIHECIEAVNLAGENGELRFFRGKGFRTRYFGPHNVSMAFVELNGLCPFMRETADEWLRPVILHDRKDRKRRHEERASASAQPDAGLAALLPCRGETDALVSVYLDQFEQIHRIVHIPTFRAAYGKAEWPAAFTVLVLSMLAVASCIHTRDGLGLVKTASDARQRAERWIETCDNWLVRQSQKHRKLIHFQIACLLYLGKRVNTIKKKRFWTGSGALVQDGVAVGLHREPSYMAGKISVYDQEMRRRIWATVQELDMQASFDHGLPTLLSQLHHDTNAPRNVDDDDFDEDTTELPAPKPQSEYTFASFQNLARQSLPLRLELSRLLTGPPSDVDYDQVILHTNGLTHEIDALPSWDVIDTDKAESRGKPLMAYTLLHVQLRQYMMPLHQPYLKLRRQNSKYQYSEVIYYNAARDIVLLHDKLQQEGVRALSFLREDALTTAINLCSVTMLQPRGSTNMIMINSHHTLKLIEKCIGMKEDRLLRCGNSEPWGYSIMCAALGLLEVHLGTKTVEEARSTSAESPDRAKVTTTTTTTASMNGSSISNMARPSMTPFTFQPTLPASVVDAAGTGALGLGDAAQLFELDPSLELLGLNLNELWGEAWELG
ncbi:hypothetical protein L249_4210 [Ophiocordyceps polyrhachis-furcata BCC 54312]|uniref:Phenylalanine--tRNA ligase, mitochondrial n=1 Tax=Ophiocordyceps polyrhachis-furcata BCC 54312 TaxID=1330021 RepID=A0A367LBW5_9HYPO|nr:hypothetical protein L249_4210 [Ophiocordyceps polyrhachis-furcata BCC 54312]